MRKKRERGGRAVWFHPSVVCCVVCALCVATTPLAWRPALARLSPNPQRRRAESTGVISPATPPVRDPCSGLTRSLSRGALKFFTPTSTGEVCTRPGDLQNMALRFPAYTTGVPSDDTRAPHSHGVAEPLSAALSPRLLSRTSTAACALRARNQRDV